MDSSKLARVGGLAAILTGAFNAAQGIPALFDKNTADLNSPADYLVEATLAASQVALLIVLVALWRLHTGRDPQSYGLLGRIGFLVAFLGSVLVILKELLILVVGAAFGSQSVLAIEGVTEGLFIAGGLLLMVGLVLLGIATLRARILPRWVGLALVLVLFVSAAFGSNGPYVELPLWLTIGYGFWSHARTREPVRAQSAAVR